MKERKSILYLCFLSLILLFFYCMMWNKLLLTEFVIYLCCLIGLMLLVFEFYWFFFVCLFFVWKFSFFFCNVCWCAHNLAVWLGQVDDHISVFWKSFTIRYRRYSSSQPQIQLIKNNPWSVPAYLCYFKRHCRFGPTDVTGCNSAKSPLRWWIMIPWLGSSEFLF